MSLTRNRSALPTLCAGMPQRLKFSRNVRSGIDRYSAA
jgi:hypothetical protein